MKFDAQQAYPYQIWGSLILALGILLGLLMYLTQGIFLAVMVFIPLFGIALYLIAVVKIRFERGKTAFPFEIQGIRRGNTIRILYGDNTIFTGKKEVTVLSEIEALDPDNLTSLLLHTPKKGDGSVTLAEAPTKPEISVMVDEEPPRNRNRRLTASRMVRFYEYLIKNQPGKTQCIAVHGSPKIVKKFRFGPGVLIKNVNVPHILRNIIRYEGR